MKYLRIAVLALELAASRHAVADQPCAPIVPEAASEIAKEGLPSQATRFQVLERVWSGAAHLLEEDVRRSLSSGSFSVAADTIQGLTNDALREAILTRHDDLAHSMLGVWLEPLDSLSRRDRYLAYYLTPTQRLSEARLDHAEEMWIEPSGIEVVLYPAIYLAGATDIALAVARRPPTERSEALTAFARRISDVATSHYRRWAFGPPKIWQVRGWGCDASGYDLVAFTRGRMDRSLGNKASEYCVAPTDLDMLLMIGISNLLKLSDVAPDIASLSSSDRERFAKLLHLQAEFMASRLVWSNATDERGQLVPTVDFDPGTWASHPDWRHAADEAPQFPRPSPMIKAGVGRDISHAYRIAWMALTLANNPEIVSDTADWNGVVDGLAHQFAHHVLDAHSAVPRFRNYLDGSNGWYRVNVDGRDGFGFPPYGLSRTYLDTPWARLANRDRKLLQATAKMWKAIANPSSAECQSFRQTYVFGSFWKDRRAVERPFSGPEGNLNVLPFVAASPVR